MKNTNFENYKNYAYKTFIVKIKFYTDITKNKKLTENVRLKGKEIKLNQWLQSNIVLYIYAYKVDNCKTALEYLRGSHYSVGNIY